MTVAGAGVSFVVAAIGADRTTERVTFSRESLCIAVTAGAGVNLVTSVGAGGVYSDSVIGVGKLADGCDISFFGAIETLA